MGKASVSNISVSPRFVVIPKALAMARLSVVASPFANLPSSPSRFCPLASLLLQKLAPYCLSILPLWSYSSSVTPSRGIALPPCLVSNTLDRCNYRRDGMVTYVSPQDQLFSPITRSHYPRPRALSDLRAAIISFVLGEPAEGFGSLSCTSLCIVSLRVWGILS